MLTGIFRLLGKGEFYATSEIFSGEHDYRLGHSAVRKINTE